MSSPHQRRPDPPTASPSAAGLTASAASMLAETVTVLCRRERLSISEIGDHTDVVAEVADALGALTDRLAADLADVDPAAGDSQEPVRDLQAIRDGLAAASGAARRCADELYRAHLKSGPVTDP